ncbi:hypothetical protein [Ferrimonas balearica]|uniref:hypothetical protein n=1 Tax=Ferrimonas balearica TaxID=44012 RepID=UPI001C98FE7F|nr:hypothetical protein [Ferrimonas balearica]MBY5920427.1 hypothetical protein [Ferrimonas balearica]MBY5996888.1 hypothetical protein [Ferrimonas balearica]
MGLKFNLLAQQAASNGYGLKINHDHPEHYDLYALSPKQQDHSVEDISYQELLSELALIDKED